MHGTPLVFRTSHRIAFSDLDPYKHMSTGNYAIYYVDHRMEGLAEHLGWDQEAMASSPFMVYVRRIEIDYIRPVLGDQVITITSLVREFRGSDAIIDCTMTDAAAKVLSRCVMTGTYVDKATSRAADWPADLMARFYTAAVDA
ncbi:MAG: thioesterase family protein [Gemmatimonadaceae bacterium]